MPSSIGILKEEGITSLAAFLELRVNDLDLLYLRHKTSITLGQLSFLRTLLETTKRSIQSQCRIQQQGIICCLLQLPISFFQ